MLAWGLKNDQNVANLCKLMKLCVRGGCGFHMNEKNEAGHGTSTKSGFPSRSSVLSQLQNGLHRKIRT
jgi:hypothetical protein